ncbi:hypothetical protein thsps21_07990 [Pseudomonas sp. No.21]|jgi:hypothetical protein|uniref:hypothetical protein n=1 Tax=Pseudomonas TaxID=286 RepID=UPI000DA75640|nr:MULTISPECIES: hypothetical protein [Pseudomonas]MDW3712578.1 hypothetical protein [Pseudomonas sp. 2023EL-01195]PZE14729.1 hypothetical protein DMX10_03435 [Pseudomonas sp. 57B-090624]GJN44305.1 hypothetical protein TUM20249_02910 [Pseudomonas tohonis]
MPQQTFTIHYRFHNEPRRHELELDQRPDPGEAAMHLLVLHFADAENSLVMPPADASAEEVVQQAELLGISDIRLS